MDGNDDGDALAERVERGELRREALELLSLAGHVEARSALGRLPLELTATERVAWPESDLPRQARSWEAPARWLQVLGRKNAVRLSVGLVDRLRARGAGTDEPPVASQVGLHTGPSGILFVTEQIAAEVFPLASTMDRTADAAREWLQDEPAGETVTAAWPSLLLTRKRVELCSDLAGVDWRAAWACRWLVACVAGPEEGFGVAAASVATYAHASLDTVSPVYESLLEALTVPLLG